MMNKKMIKIVIGIVLVSVVVVAGFFAIKDTFEKKSEQIEAQNASGIQASYNEYEVKKKAIGSEERANGTMVPFDSEKISIPEGALIIKKNVNNGEQVNVKQLLMSVKTSDGEYKNIYSTLHGIYSEINDDNNQTSYYVYGIDRVGMKLSVNENNIAKIALNQKANVYISALDKTIEGTIASINPIGNDGKFFFTVQVPYSDELKFGYSAAAQIQTRGGEEKLVVPTDTIFYDNNDASKQFVVLAKHKKAVEKLSDPFNIPEEYRTYVTTNTSDNSDIEIVSGLEGNETILQVVYGG